MPLIVSRPLRLPLAVSATVIAFALAAACGSSEPTAEKAAPEPTEIVLSVPKMFPESLTSTSDGTLIMGSAGLGSIYRVAPGQTTAVEWVAPKTNGMGMVLGVFADESSNTLWVCSNNTDGTWPEPPALLALNLASGELKGKYPIPGEMKLCNDIAVAADGTAYLADTIAARVWMLKPGAAELELASDDMLLTGADGLAFGAQPNQLIVNSVSEGKLLRLDLGADGKATAVTELTPSRMLERPDGMRSLGGGRFLLAEGPGRMDLVTIAGDAATIETLKDAPASTPAVTATRGMAWVMEGKLEMRNDPEQAAKATEFKLYAVPLPQ